MYQRTISCRRSPRHRHTVACRQIRAQQQSAQHPRRLPAAGSAAGYGSTILPVAFCDFTHRHVAVSHFAPDYFVDFVHHVPPLLPHTFYETASRFPMGTSISQIADLVIDFILAPFPRNVKNPHQPERHRRTDKCGLQLFLMKLMTDAHKTSRAPATTRALIA